MLVGLDLDRRPALLRANDLLIGDQPAALPIVTHGVFAVLSVDEHGAAAVVYAATSPLPPALVLLDFEVTGITSALWGATKARLLDLLQVCRARDASLWVPEPLVPSARAAGVPVEAIPKRFDDTAEVALAVAGYVSAGQVKMCEAVAEKAKAIPFRASLDFRSGDVGDDPLRWAAVLAIALGLEDTRTTRRAV